MEINFVSFGSTNNFKNSLKRIESEAYNLQVFTNVWCLDESLLDNIFYTTHKTFIEQNPRGYGYWIWKPQVILQALINTHDEQFVVYADTGCTIQNTGKHKLYEYIKLLENDDKGILAFDIQPFLESEYSKMDTINQIFKHDSNIDDITNSYQRTAMVIILKNTKIAMNFIKEWLDLCVFENYHFVDDSPSLLTNSHCFVEHRHDQSIFSLLTKKYNIKTLPFDLSHDCVFLGTRKYD